MKLIYCAYPLIDQGQEPDWVGKFADNRFVQREGWALYRPAFGFMENAEALEVVAALNRPPRITEAQATAMKLEPDLLQPLGQVKNRLAAADAGPFLDVSFKRLYALLRADIVLVDLNGPDHGCKAQETLYAYLMHVPVVGIAHRFILSPAMLDKVSCVLFPRASDEIVRQVLAFDHRTTAALERYRPNVSSEKLAELSRRARELAEQQHAQSELDGAEDAEQPDGRDESTR
jgi:hypothetical protein